MVGDAPKDYVAAVSQLLAKTNYWNYSKTFFHFNSFTHPNHKLYKKLGKLESSNERNPIHINSPLVVGCSVGHKPLLLYFRWTSDEIKTQSTSQIIFFSKMVSVILIRSYHIDVYSSVNYSDHFDCNIFCY